MHKTSGSFPWLSWLVALILTTLHISAEFIDFPLKAVSISNVDFINERKGVESEALAQLREQAKPTEDTEFYEIISHGMEEIKKEYPAAESRLKLLYIRQDWMARSLVIKMGYHEARPARSMPQWGPHVPPRPFFVTVTASSINLGAWSIGSPHFEEQPPNMAPHAGYNRDRSLAPMRLTDLYNYRIDVERAWAIAQLASWRRPIKSATSVIITRPRPSFQQALEGQIQFEFNVGIEPRKPNQALSNIGHDLAYEAWITVGMDADINHVAYSTRRPINVPET